MKDVFIYNVIQIECTHRKVKTRTNTKESIQLYIFNIHLPQINLESLPFKIQAFSGAIDQDPDEFLTNFKLSAEVLNWTTAKLPSIFHMCLTEAARVWFHRQPETVRHNIHALYKAFLAKYKTKGLDWNKEAIFTSLKQLSQEAARTFADRVIEQGAKLDKSDKEINIGCTQQGANDFMQTVSNGQNASTSRECTPKYINCTSMLVVFSFTGVTCSLSFNFTASTAATF